MKCFITGSRWYGAPKHDSDLDIVLCCPSKYWPLLHPSCDKVNSDEPEYTRSSLNYRYGKLNLIIVSSRWYYLRWRLARFICWCKSPINRDTAVAIHKWICK